MDALGPFAEEREVMVAVSGGADSMALALLLSRWGRPRAAIVDHGMRPESANEAAAAARNLARLGIPATVLLAHLPAGPAAAERARYARYQLLLQACRDAGCPDLLLAHHAADQAETVRMRQDAASAPAGLAGMAAISYRDEARLLRPLLGLPPGRLRATLRAAGIGWAEDPTNHDPRTLRARLRATMDRAALSSALATAARHGAERARSEQQLAAELVTVRFHPAGYALLPHPISAGALSSVIWTISGNAYPPPRATLSAGLSTRSVHGVLIRSAGRLGAGVLIAREPGAVAPPTAGPRWDGRFRLLAMPPGLALGALGGDAARFGRRGPLPALLRRSLPALRQQGEIVAVPHLGFHDKTRCPSVSTLFSPPRPAAGAPFVNPSSVEGM